MKFKHTDTSYYMHICGLEAFLNTLKMKKYSRNIIKESSPKPFKILKIILLWGGTLGIVPTLKLKFELCRCIGHIM